MAVNKVKRNGSYAPLSAHYYKDDAIDEAGEAAELLFVRGLAFCADVLSDGFISDRQLVRFVGVGLTDVEGRAKRLVAAGLWDRADSGYVVRSWLDWNRSRSEITDYQAKDRARKSRKDGPQEVPEAVRADSERNPDGDRTDSAEHSERSPVGFQPRARTPRNSTTKTEKKLSVTADAATGKIDLDERFDEFWVIYPRKIQKQDAVRAWREVRRKGLTPERIIDGARRYARLQAGQDPKFVKHPASWLRAGGFDDEPDPVRVGRLPSLPVDPGTAFAELRDRADAQGAARLAGLTLLLDPQPPSDRTDPAAWERARRVEWLDLHRSKIEAALRRKAERNGSS